MSREKESATWPRPNWLNRVAFWAGSRGYKFLAICIALFGIPPCLMIYYGRYIDFFAIFIVTLGFSAGFIGELCRRILDDIDLRRDRTKTIHRPPGRICLRIVDFFYSPKTVENVFVPLVADWQKEYFDAIHQRRNLKARWVSIRYIWRVCIAMGLLKVVSLIRKAGH